MIDWSLINYFDPEVDHFPEDPDKYASPKLITNLDLLRAITGTPLFISPVSGALARFDGSKTSRHYAVGRLSDAVDVFSYSKPADFFIKALSSKLFGGIGIYFDTKYKNRPHVMFHLDNRPLTDGIVTVWYRNEKKYFYTRNDPTESLNLIKLLGAN